MAPSSRVLNEDADRYFACRAKAGWSQIEQPAACHQSDKHPGYGRSC